MNTLTKYSGFTRCAVSARLNYRGRLFLNILGQIIEIAASLFLWRTLFREQSVISGYEWNDMIFYLLISFIMNATMGQHAESRIQDKVLTGQIAMDLAKPLDFQLMCLAESIGSSMVDGVIVLVIGSAAAVLAGDITKILTISRMGMFLLSYCLAFLIKFCLAYLAGLCCFFTSNGYGVRYLWQVIMDIFSGAMLPIAFFPLWFRKLSAFLPFRSVVYLPTQIFLGRVDGIEAWETLGIQALWVIVMWVLGKLCFKAAVRKITIQGG